MKIKEIEIIKDSLFANMKFITSYHSYYDDHNEMIEKFTTCLPRKGDIIKVLDKHTHQSVFLTVKCVFIDYVEDKMTIWCK